MKSFVAALLAFMAGIFPTIVADVEIPDLRYLKAYREKDFEGSFEEFLNYVPDLSAYSIDNDIESACYTGTWIMYPGVHYELDYGIPDTSELLRGVDHCYSFLPSALDKASSLRYAGSPYGLNDVYYNLYKTNFYMGAELKGNTNIETLGKFGVSSLIISGQSPWTFFTGDQYTGEAVCVYPSSSSTGDNGIRMDNYFVQWMRDLGLQDNSIRSVARGCLSERIVGLPPSEASRRPEGDHKLTNNAH